MSALALAAAAAAAAAARFPLLMDTSAPFRSPVASHTRATSRAATLSCWSGELLISAASRLLASMAPLGMDTNATTGDLRPLPEGSALIAPSSGPSLPEERAATQSDTVKQACCSSRPSAPNQMNSLFSDNIDELDVYNSFSEVPGGSPLHASPTASDNNPFPLSESDFKSVCVDYDTPVEPPKAAGGATYVRRATSGGGFSPSDLFAACDDQNEPHGLKPHGLKPKALMPEGESTSTIGELVPEQSVSVLKLSDIPSPECKQLETTSDIPTPKSKQPQAASDIPVPKSSAGKSPAPAVISMPATTKPADPATTVLELRTPAPEAEPVPKRSDGQCGLAELDASKLNASELIVYEPGTPKLGASRSDASKNTVSELSAPELNASRLDASKLNASKLSASKIKLVASMASPVRKVAANQVALPVLRTRRASCGPPAQNMPEDVFTTATNEWDRKCPEGLLGELPNERAGARATRSWATRKSR
ncbi:hypothetical protein FOA52_014431 [Chlamydomonas sp. UWO 241]|nr:hypothetical protein FOA52_014431 [Chlamydomonas sp. UWO 241]